MAEEEEEDGWTKDQTPYSYKEWKKTLTFDKIESILVKYWEENIEW